jgi:hypothetical protein
MKAISAQPAQKIKTAMPWQPHHFDHKTSLVRMVTFDQLGWRSSTEKPSSTVKP